VLRPDPLVTQSLPAPLASRPLARYIARGSPTRPAKPGRVGTAAHPDAIRMEPLLPATARPEPAEPKTLLSERPEFRLDDHPCNPPPWTLISLSTSLRLGQAARLILIALPRNFSPFFFCNLSGLLPRHLGAVLALLRGAWRVFSG